MDIQKHARIEQIRGLSQHLYRGLTVVRFLLFLGWPMLLVLLFIPQGVLELGDAALEIQEIGVGGKLIVLFLYLVALVFMQKLAKHFRNLVGHFKAGDIFTEDAILEAKLALISAIAVFVIWFIQQLAGWIFQPSVISPGLLWDVLVAAVLLGFMSTLLWALEIGSDLNEESEMTI